MTTDERLFEVLPDSAPDDARTCASCGEQFPPDAFPPVNKSATGRVQLRPDCRRCHQRHKKVRQEYRESGAYARDLERQGGRCACCGDEPRPGTTLHVDHDHQTMVVRGLLCERCNVGGGKLGDAERALQWALYLIRTGRAA